MELLTAPTHWLCSCGACMVDFTEGCFRMDYGGFHTGVLPHGRRQEYDRPLRGRGQKGAYPHYRQHSSVAHTTARHHRSPPLSGPEGVATYLRRSPRRRVLLGLARLRVCLRCSRSARSCCNAGDVPQCDAIDRSARPMGSERSPVWRRGDVRAGSRCLCCCTLAASRRS